MKSTLMIKDLALDKQLDRKSMSAVRGGHKITVTDNSGNIGNIVAGNENEVLNNSAVFNDSFNQSFNHSFNGHGYGHGRSPWAMKF